MHKKVKTVKSTSSKKVKTIKSSSSKQYFVKKPSENFLQKCIDEHDSIIFTYVDGDGVITDRSATPEKIFWGYSNREVSGKKIRTCWVEAYCHLRNDRRTFIKDRMSKVRIN